MLSRQASLTSSKDVYISANEDELTIRPEISVPWSIPSDLIDIGRISHWLACYLSVCPVYQSLVVVFIS